MMPVVVCSSLLTALGLVEASQIGVVEHLEAEETGEGPVEVEPVLEEPVEVGPVEVGPVLEEPVEVGPVPEDFAAVE